MGQQLPSEGALSSDDLQKLAIMLAVCHEPQLLVLDELKESYAEWVGAHDSTPPPPGK